MGDLIAESNLFKAAFTLTYCVFLLFQILEYIRAYDYSNGYVAIFDYRDISLLDFVAQINLTELRQFIGYCMVSLAFSHDLPILIHWLDVELGKNVFKWN